MSYTESGVKMIAEIKNLITIIAIRRGGHWYSENDDGTTSHVAFGRVDVLPGGHADDIRFTMDVAPIDRDISACAVGSVLIVAEIDDAERAAYNAGDIDIMHRKIDAATSTAARRVADIMGSEHAAGVV